MKMLRIVSQRELSRCASNAHIQRYVLYVQRCDGLITALLVERQCEMRRNSVHIQIRCSLSSHQVLVSVTTLERATITDVQIHTHKDQVSHRRFDKSHGNKHANAHGNSTSIQKVYQHIGDIQLKPRKTTSTDVTSICCLSIHIFLIQPT